ncbi:CBN-NHR-145 protein [Caenorhabditis brenneri]|uniref:CBN-NHR-145 protein n=1 Tax=Caenorhabditis brenneri TaxID=135651 RepID=G0N3A0_CAEBE|nr:CBN-NHR-145 protein [Caenorhabditis brenneri]
MCQLDGIGRPICRFCRFEKCKEIGMDPDKVVLDYDPTASQKVPVLSKTDTEPTETTETETGPISTMTGNASYKAGDQIKIKIDFTETVEKIEEIFETKKTKSDDETEDEDGTDRKSLNDLENLVKGLADFRAPLWQKQQIMKVGTADMKMVFVWLNVRIRKYATWFSHATYLMDKLPMSEKFQLYRTSWNVLRIFERIAMTWKHYGEEMFEKNFILVSDDSVMMIDKSLIHFEEISELTNGHFQKLFHPFLNKYIEEVARPLSELDLTEEEVVFCMVNILGFDVTGLSPETLEVLHKFKEIIGDQMHNYYVNCTNYKMYSHRILKLMKLVKTITGIAREKSRIKEMIWLFDIYKADISDPYFFQMF